MTTMAVLARYGHVQPDVFGEMDYLEAQELAKRVLQFQHDEEKRYTDLHLELTKAIMKSNGARVL